MSRDSELLKEAVALLEHYCDKYEAVSAFLAKVKAEPQTDADGWIPWHGGECPVAYLTPVFVRHRSGGEFECRAGEDCAEDWSHDEDDEQVGDIIAYKIAPR